jgi:NADH-quinone oxidoreductase subunit H
MLVIVFFMVTRWSWPRFRFDQLMALAWKIMLPLGMVNFLVVAVFNEVRAFYDPAALDSSWDWWLAIPGWITCLVAWVVVAFCGTVVTDNAPRRDLDLNHIDNQIPVS